MALLRVKRRRDEDAIDVLLLAYKKQKTEDPSFANVFKFAGTVEGKEEDVKVHVNNAKEAFDSGKSFRYEKRQVSDITKKLKAENKLFSKNNRLKVINCFRTGENEEEKELTVVDIENQPQQITNEAPKDSCSLASTEEQYVYDLYYSSGNFDDLLMENVLSAHAVNEDLLFGDFLDKDEDDDGVMDDEDDSNDENNWRNDYPDEESDDSKSSIDEHHLRLAMQMKNINLDGEYESDLSSDREDEALIFSEDHRGDYYYCTSPTESDDSDRID
ncbi:probable RNA polymerase II nuclear localization protein SLC7A6OS [Halyomorpha halys]|uniref:probable RNA polymerase II nuclear localization protein SLC7A6OS n=1 Tax=Halyomorpha halys TaxID=286706 RepID=UPI0006D4E266|nr:probable RNA polymerase II nuclear localization protein SLC7A6OS [Halyomorpha halys]